MKAGNLLSQSIRANTDGGAPQYPLQRPCALRTLPGSSRQAREPALGLDPRDDGSVGGQAGSRPTHLLSSSLVTCPPLSPHTPLFRLPLSSDYPELPTPPAQQIGPICAWVRTNTYLGGKVIPADSIRCRITGSLRTRAESRRTVRAGISGGPGVVPVQAAAESRDQLPWIGRRRRREGYCQSFRSRGAAGTSQPFRRQGRALQAQVAGAGGGSQKS